MNNRARITHERCETLVFALNGESFRSERAFKRRAAAKRAGAETLIRRGYPISEL